MDTDTFDAVFWSFFITSGIAFLLGITKLAYNSKCREVKCCCLHIVRDVEMEERGEEFRLSYQPHPQTRDIENGVQV
jgi:hypothetical protein